MLTSPLVGSLQVAGRQLLIGSRPSLASHAATGPNPVPPGFYPTPGHYVCFPIQLSSSEMQCTSAQAASSGTDGSGDTHLAKNSDSEDVIQLLDEAEALELIEFDPDVDSKDTWDPPKSMTSYLEKHFNRSLSDAEREAIMNDFPKPNCHVMSAPKLDEQVKDQLEKRKRPPFWCRKISLQNSGPTSRHCWSTRVLVGRSTE